MHHALLIALLALQAPDTTVRLTGLIRMPGDTGSTQASLWLPYPVAVASGRVRAVALPGDAGRWSRYADRYVEAEGHILPPATLSVTHIREVKLPGEGRRQVDPSFTQHATVTLAIVPQRVQWQDSAGRPTGVSAVAYYTIRNQGNTPLVFMFSTTDILCMAVTPAGSSDARWRDGWHPTRVSERVNVEMGAVVHYIAPLPERAAPAPGRYTAHASLCGNPDYEVTTEFEVVSPG